MAVEGRTFGTQIVEVRRSTCVSVGGFTGLISSIPPRLASYICLCLFLLLSDQGDVTVAALVATSSIEVICAVGSVRSSFRSRSHEHEHPEEPHSRLTRYHSITTPPRSSCWRDTAALATKPRFFLEKLETPVFITPETSIRCQWLALNRPTYWSLI